MSTNARAQPLKNVVTVFDSDTATIRRAGEDRMALDLSSRGVRATPSYAIFGDQAVDDREAVKARLRTMGYDGVVMMRLVEAHQEIDYAPGTWGGYGYWGGYYSGGYPYVQTIVRMETRAYSLRDGQLVWSALTKSYEDDAGEVVEDASRITAKQLSEQGLAG